MFSSACFTSAQYDVNKSLHGCQFHCLCFKSHQSSRLFKQGVKSPSLGALGRQTITLTWKEVWIVLKNKCCIHAENPEKFSMNATNLDDADTRFLGKSTALSRLQLGHRLQSASKFQHILESKSKPALLSGAAESRTPVQLFLAKAFYVRSFYSS